MDDNQRLLDSIDSMKGPVNQPNEKAAPAMSLGEAFTKSAAYGSLRSGFKSGSLGGRWSTGAVELDFPTKATITSTASPINQEDIRPGFQQAAAVALRRLTVADLLAQGTTDAAAIRYLLETTNTNAASSVAEGAAKPESTITFTEVDEPVRKVATFLPVSDEMLEDEMGLRSYLDQRLSLFVQHAEEAQLLNGNGTSPDLRGLLNRTGVQTATRSALGVLTGETGGSTTLGNAFFQAIQEIRTDAQAEPDGIIVHPDNWTKMRTAKDSAGQYLGGGPMIGAYGNGLMATETYWGLPVVVTSAITANTALVGAFKTMAQVFYRNGLTVEASNSHDDFFQKNLTAIRAERRLALAVYRPEAFFKITALQTA
jgi:HK97 family phage major capsid protein